MSSSDPIDRVRELLVGYPPATIEAGIAFAKSRAAADLDRLVLGVLAFHLPAQGTPRLDLTTLPMTTRLVADLGVDSLALVEMSFLLDDLLGVRLTDVELRALVTLGDLLGTLRTRSSRLHPPHP